ncbi:NRDE family protein [Fibrella aquatilis]|uniref:NRDE family protein n=1 Tax=Fibrella aquatilis TaxID=2817059 RepID=A0A939K0C5_9BACT|nr:NRDE family protein [Fibrella aquatilis]MBO0932333.1 NRDE family protein [Fibrella aquatilis]
MCTATYIPLSPDRFILTHSRDEQSVRPAALPPRTQYIGGRAVTYPVDPQGGGTWIASTNNTVVCLLNGAFTAHQKQPFYKHSRGLVIPHFLGYSSAAAFVLSYPFAGIEPFTLLVVEAGKLLVIRWTGVQRFVEKPDANQPHIWSSVTLYDPLMQQKRERWFANWCATQATPTVADVRRFHQTAGDGDPATSLLMSRAGTLQTISLTSIDYNANRAVPGQMIYQDFTKHLSQHPNPLLTHANA